MSSPAVKPSPADSLRPAKAATDGRRGQQAKRVDHGLRTHLVRVMRRWMSAPCSASSFRPFTRCGPDDRASRRIRGLSTPGQAVCDCLSQVAVGRRARSCLVNALHEAPCLTPDLADDLNAALSARYTQQQGLRRLVCHPAS